MSSPGVKYLLPSTRFTQETEGKEILGLAQGGGHLEQFLYRNVLNAVTVHVQKACLLDNVSSNLCTA